MSKEDSWADYVTFDDPHNQAVYEKMVNERTRIFGKLEDLMQDEVEHNLVLEELMKLDPNRRCFRMVGAVLVERNVKEVTVALTDHRNRVQSLIKELKKQVELKQEEIVKFTNEVGTKPIKESNIPST